MCPELSAPEQPVPPSAGGEARWGSLSARIQTPGSSAQARAASVGGVLSPSPSWERRLRVRGHGGTRERFDCRPDAVRVPVVKAAPVGELELAWRSGPGSISMAENRQKEPVTPELGAAGLLSKPSHFSRF